MGVDNRKIHEAFQNDVPLMVNTGSAEEGCQSRFSFCDQGRYRFAEPGLCQLRPV